MSEQVANIISRADNFSGQFSWKPEFRPHYTDPLLTRGAISVSGRKGDIEYELGLRNDNSWRIGAGGGTVITDGAGTVRDRRTDIWKTTSANPQQHRSSACWHRR